MSKLYFLETRFFKDRFILLRRFCSGPARTCFSHLKFYIWWGPHSLKQNTLSPSLSSILQFLWVSTSRALGELFFSPSSPPCMTTLFSSDWSSDFAFFFLSFQAFHWTHLLGVFSWTTSSSSSFLLVWTSLGKSFNPPLQCSPFSS